MMNNTSLFMAMVNEYHKLSAAQNYIWGFTYRHNVYMAITDESVVSAVCKLDKASRGAGYALRFCPTVDQKLYLMNKATVLCSEKYFKELKADSIYNNGEIFEKVATEHFGQNWKKDNVPFTEAGDININGIEYQIKFEKATFCNEKSLANLRNRG